MLAALRPRRKGTVMGENYDKLSSQELIDLCKENFLFTWKAQKGYTPLPVSRAEGIFIYDPDDKRYFDFSSQLMCTNLGHGYKKVVDTIKEQLDNYQFVFPGQAHVAKGLLAKMIKEIAPGDMKKVFFSLGGAEAIENSIKMVRMVTGRHKVLARYRSYHGATYGAATLGGDPRRFAAEPGISGVVHFYGPYPYRCPFFSKTDEECRDRSLTHLEETILMEGPQTIAGLFLEGISGSSGIFLYPDGYMEGVRALCDKYDILLVIDEVMSGFGRTGKWFGCQHYDAKPDLIVMAKGLTSSYVPLGAVAVNKRVANHFEEKPMICGLTYSGHPVSCSGGIGTIRAFKEDKILEHVEEVSKVQQHLLEEMKEKHKCVGEIRNIGLFGVIDCVKSRKTHEPMAPWNAKPSEMATMNKVAASLKENGLITFVRWNFVFCVPPLIITQDQLEEAFGIIDLALDIADEAYGDA